MDRRMACREGQKISYGVIPFKKLKNNIGGKKIIFHLFLRLNRLSKISK